MITLLESPYFGIEVTNDSNEIVKNVELFKTYEYLDSENAHKFDEDGNLKIGNLKIATTNKDLSYRELLVFVSKFNRLKMEKVYLYSANKEQVLETFKVEQKNCNGKTFSDIFIPVFHPRQNQEHSIEVWKNFELDFATTFTISQVQPNTKVCYHFYKEDTKKQPKLITVIDKLLPAFVALVLAFGSELLIKLTIQQTAIIFSLSLGLFYIQKYLRNKFVKKRYITFRRKI